MKSLACFMIIILKSTKAVLHKLACACELLDIVLNADFDSWVLESGLRFCTSAPAFLLVHELHFEWKGTSQQTADVLRVLSLFYCFGLKYVRHTSWPLFEGNFLYKRQRPRWILEGKRKHEGYGDNVMYKINIKKVKNVTPLYIASYMKFIYKTKTRF